MKTHTPTPWSYHPAKNVEPRSLDRPDLFDLPASVTNKTGDKKLKIGGISPEGDANAEFIVEAVNAHDSLKAQRDALLSALKAMVEAFDHQWETEQEFPHKTAASLKASAAIALCESEVGK